MSTSASAARLCHGSISVCWPSWSLIRSLRDLVPALFWWEPAPRAPRSPCNPNTEIRHKSRIVLSYV